LRVAFFVLVAFLVLEVIERLSDDALLVLQEVPEDLVEPLQGVAVVLFKV
jgi:hypothetical protein